jgi:adenosine deaminase
VWDTLRELAPERIGHGIRSIEDPALVEHLQRTGIHLEVCPSCNVQIVESIHSRRDHPLERLRAAGVSVNIKTHTRPMMGITLTDEYARAREHFGWTTELLFASNRAALRHAFVDEETKAALMARLEETWAST